MIRRLFTAAGVASAALLAIAGPVSAHLEPNPTQAQAGSRVAVGFIVGPAPAMVLTDPVETESSTENVATESTVATSSSKPAVISAGVDEAASSETGTVAFILSIAAVLAIGGFVVFRSRQSRAEIARRD